MTFISKVIQRTVLAATVSAFVFGATLVAGSPVSARSGGGIEGSTYSGPLFGFQVEWDDRVWDAEDSSNATQDHLLLSGDRGQLQFMGTTDYGDDVHACVDATQAAIARDPDVTDASILGDELDRPQPGDGGATGLFGFTLDLGDGATLDGIDYVECRPLTADAVVLISLIVFDRVDAARPFPNMAIDADIVIGSLEVESTGDEPAETGRKPGAIDKIGELGKVTRDRSDGNADTELKPAAGLQDTSFVSESFGFWVTWDEEAWYAIGEAPAEQGEGVYLLSEDAGTLAIVVATDAYPDDRSCLEANGPVDVTVHEHSHDAPRSRLGGTYSLDAYTVEYESGPIHEMQYVECVPLADGMLVLTLIGDEADYEAIVDGWEHFIAGIELS